jgi:putative ABC transport system substrate-binding protein
MQAASAAVSPRPHDEMKRRTFLAAVGPAPFTCASLAHGQVSSSPLVGLLNSASAATYSFNAAAFRDGLRDAGYTEGENVTIEYRWANNDYGQLPALAAELARRNVAVIAATGDIASARADEVIQ